MKSRRRSTKHRAVPAKESRPITVGEGAEVLGTMLRVELAELADPRRRLTNTQRQSQIKRCVTTLQMLGKLTGEQLTEREIIRHPRFQAALAVVTRALEAYPDAMVAVARALQDATGGAT